MSDLSMLINGHKAFAKNGATFERRNPLGDPRLPAPVVLGSVVDQATVLRCNAH